MLEIEGQEIEEQLNAISKRLVASTVQELLTPVQLQHNVEINAIKKQLEEN